MSGVGLGEIPRNVKEFIRKYITSLDELEILLLLRGTPRKSWDSVAISRALQMDPKTAIVRLDHLSAAGLVQSGRFADEIGYKYLPETSAIRTVIDQLAQVYPKYQVRIISIIYSRSEN